MCVCSQLYPTSCDPMDCNSPGSSVHGISQGRILEWAAISYSRDFSYPWIEPTALVSPTLAVRFFTTAPPGKPKHCEKSKHCGAHKYKTYCLLLGILSLVRELRYYLNVQQVVVPNQTTNTASGMERKNSSVKKMKKIWRSESFQEPSHRSTNETRNPEA